MPVIVDTDVSLDDVMAILYLLRRPDVDIRAITVSGTGVARCAAGVPIVLGLLAVAEKQAVPVACGAETPLEGSNAFPDPWRDARDAMATAGILPAGGQPSVDTASAVIVAAAAASPAPPTMLVLGPHTNLAQALRDQPELEQMLAAIHIMGGTLDEPGNTLDNPRAEWNLWIDPVANAEVFATDLPLSIVPLDATSYVPMTEGFAERLAANLATPEAEAALALLRLDPESTTSGLSMWDQLAVASLLEPEVVAWTDLMVAVDPSTDPARSGTLTAGAGRPARVALTADRAAFEQEYLLTVTGVDVDGSDPEAAIKRDYIAQADQVCTSTDQDVNGAYESVLQGVDPEAPPTAELFGELWTRLDPIFRDQLAALRAISPPPTDVEALEALYGAFEAAIADVQASVDAALAGDPAALGRLTGQSGGDDPFATANQLARDYGMRVCGGSD